MAQASNQTSHLLAIPISLYHNYSSTSFRQERFFLGEVFVAWVDILVIPVEAMPGYRRWRLHTVYYQNLLLGSFSQIPVSFPCISFPHYPLNALQSQFVSHYTSSLLPLDLSYSHSHLLSVYIQNLFQFSSYGEPGISLRGLIVTKLFQVCGLQHDYHLLNSYYLLISEYLPCLLFWMSVTLVRNIFSSSIYLLINIMSF